MADLGPTWALIALVLFIGGALVYTRGLRPNDRRNGRRLMLAAPVWPLAAVVLLGASLATAVAHLFPKERHGHRN